MDVDTIRRDFPVLSREVKGKPLVYLDSAATSQKPAAVIDKVADCYRRYNANPHRGIHTLSEESTEEYEGAREKLAAFLGAETSGVVFTRNCTEAINLVAYAWARRNLGRGDKILATVTEHHSNIVPWQIVSRETGVAVEYLPVTDDGYLDLSGLDKLLDGSVKLVAVSGASNVLGTVNDLSALVAAAHDAGALVLVDGAQLVPHTQVDFDELGADFLAVAGHKMLGPSGIGALIARPELLEEMEPFMGGGGMIVDVTLEGSKWIEPPWKFEAGTPPLAEAIGLGAAVDYLSGIGMDRVRHHEQVLAEHALAKFAELDDFTLYGPQEPADRLATFSFNVGDSRGGIIHPHDAGTFFDSAGIAVRAGHHCAKPLMRRLGVVATCRASCYIYNTPAEIDALVDTVHRMRKFFIGVQ
ncbi:MAG: SufS family cysteine desulfurase [Candidatus Glassbacteria bacterium]|nr:SufS family cysteine desulfurase [Candidatus Glassbacteria bacterium]